MVRVLHAVALEYRFAVKVSDCNNLAFKILPLCGCHTQSNPMKWTEIHTGCLSAFAAMACRMMQNGLTRQVMHSFLSSLIKECHHMLRVGTTHTYIHVTPVAMILVPVMH